MFSLLEGKPVLQILEMPDRIVQYHSLAVIFGNTGGSSVPEGALRSYPEKNGIPDYRGQSEESAVCSLKEQVPVLYTSLQGPCKTGSGLTGIGSPSGSGSICRSLGLKPSESYRLYGCHRCTQTGHKISRLPLGQSAWKIKALA